MASKELLKLLHLRLYDIQNMIVTRMMEKDRKRDYIEYDAVNEINNKTYRVTIFIQEIE